MALLLILNLLISQALAGESVLLASVSGSASLEIHRGKQLLLARAGTPLQSKDVIHTHAQQSAQLIFPDGSQLWLAPESLAEINSAKAEDGHRVQLVQMTTGSARTFVLKADSPQRRLKFLIKTPVATMGVRGTDFVVDVDLAKKHTDLHTLDGTVEIAATLTDVLKENSVPVSKGFAIGVDAARPIPQRVAFQVKEYQQQLMLKNPGFIEFNQRPKPNPKQVEPQVLSPDDPVAKKIEQDYENLMKNREKQIDNAVH